MIMSKKISFIYGTAVPPLSSVKSIVLTILATLAISVIYIPASFTAPQIFTNNAAAAEDTLPGGSKISSSDKDAFISAVNKGDLNEVKKFVENGVDVNTKFVQITMDLSGANDYTAVMAAASKGHFEILTYLLEKGADIAALDSKGRSAWDYAEAYDHKKNLDILKAKGAGPSPDTKKIVAEIRAIKCKKEMDHIYMALELYDMEGGLTPTVTINELVKNKYIKQTSRCLQNPDEDYMIVISGSANKLQYDVKCKTHGSYKELK